MKSFLDRLGIYGYNYVHERAMLASILTGTPVLFIGDIGEAKTKAAEMMAALLNEPFQKIAADKAQFEDMVGFPNPKSLGEGEVEFVRTKLSIWEKRFILIDEISRCNPQMQNKFLEVVLDRQLMGLPTDIKWVWATMNPLDYPGSQPLDGALAGRMGYVLQVKQVVDQPDHIIQKVVASRNYAQTPALSHWTDETRDHRSNVSEELREEMRDLMFKAGQLFTGLEDHWISTISKYVAGWASALKTQTTMKIDGRRLVMMGNNIIANIAIQTVQQGHALSVAELKELCSEVIPLSIPWLATGISATFDVAKFKAAHKAASAVLDTSDSLLYRIVTEQDAVNKVKLYLENRKRIDSADATSLIASIYDPVKVVGTDEEIWTAKAERFMLQLAVATLVLDLDNISSEVISLAAKNYPIHFDKRSILQEKSTSIRVKLTTLMETQVIIELYRELMDSKDPRDIARAYFTFQSERLTLTPEEINERLSIAERACNRIVSEFSKFTHKEPNANPNGSVPVLHDAAANALAEILSSQINQAVIDRSGTTGSTCQVSGSTTSV